MNTVVKTALLTLFICVCVLAQMQPRRFMFPHGERATFDGEFGGELPLNGWHLRGDGKYGRYQITPAQTGSDSMVLTITSNGADKAPWMLELFQQVSRNVEPGCTMFVSFEYKMSAGYSFQFYWQVDSEPWDKLMSLHLTGSANAWHTVRVKAPVHESYASDSTAFSFHLAEAAGILQLRNFVAVIVPPDINPEDIETTEDAVLGGDFYDRVWRARTRERFERSRLVPVSVRVVSKTGETGVGDVSLDFKQQERSFKLGVAVSALGLKPELQGHPAFSGVLKTIGNNVPFLTRYNDVILKDKLFQYALSTDWGNWRAYEDWGREVESELVSQVQAAGKTLRVGYLYEPAFQAFPTRLRELDYDDFASALTGYFKDMPAQHEGRVTSWGVVHDAVVTREITDYIGVDAVPKAFGAALKGDKYAELCLSDSHVLTDVADNTMRDFAELVIWLKSLENVRIDGIWLDANMKHLDVAPQGMERRLRLLYKLTGGVPVHITNLAVNVTNEQRQSDVLKDYVLLFCSIPWVKSISLGELWSPLLTNSSMGYLRGDYSAKPSYAMVRDFFNVDFTSNVRLSTGDDGCVQCNLFSGTYVLTVQQEGQAERTLTVEVPERAELPINAAVFKGDGYTVSRGRETGVTVTINLD